ncbi:MAG: hypothetical protein ACTSUE_25740 [Promethearchaeota archaeon]
MPLGVFLLQWSDDGFVIRANFHDDKSILDELVMRISINHGENNSFSKIPARDGTTILSLYGEFKDDRRKEQKVILGVYTRKKEDPGENEQLLRELYKGLKEHINEADDALGPLLYALYASNQQVPAGDGLNEEIRGKLVSKAKKLIKSQEIEQAQELLELAKVVPDQIKSLIDRGNKLLKQKKVPDAEKLFSEAIALAKKIGEDDLARSLSQQVSRTTEKPKIMEKIKSMEEQALKALKDLKIKRAAEFFLKASKEAFKMNDVELMNEFLRKHEILAEFHAIDKAKNRSF